MSASTSRFAYDDAYAILDAAIADDRGVRVKMLDYSAANYMRARCHMARKLDRKENAATYERPHPLHGVSQYDKVRLTIAIHEGETWLVLTRNNLIPGEVQSLTTGEQLELDMPQLSPPPKQIEHRPATDDELAEDLEAMPTVAGEVLPPVVKPAIRRI